MFWFWRVLVMYIVLVKGVGKLYIYYRKLGFLLFLVNFFREFFIFEELLKVSVKFFMFLILNFINL